MHDTETSYVMLKPKLGRRSDDRRAFTAQAAGAKIPWILPIEPLDTRRHELNPQPQNFGRRAEDRVLVPRAPVSMTSDRACR
jgi:hypothetical protein